MWPVYLHFSLLGLNIVLWALKYRNLETALRLLGLLLLLTLLFEGYAAYLMFSQVRNLYLFHILTPLQYALTALVLREGLQSARVKRVVLYSIPVYLLVSLMLTCLVQGTAAYNSYALVFRSLLITCWVLCYFREIFSRRDTVRLEREPMFWVNSGLLLYALGSFFLDGLMNYLLLQAHAMVLYLYYGRMALDFMLYAMFLLAFVLHRPGRPVI